MELDGLIHALINDSGLELSREDKSRLKRRITRADFNRRQVDVDPSLVGDEFQGKPLRPRENSLLAHLAKRAKGDGQWSEETTERGFLSDLKRAVRQPGAEIAVYKRRNADYVAVAAPNVVPEHRRGPDSRDFIVVYYSVGAGECSHG